VARLRDDLAGGLRAGRTLGGCLILPRRGKILICREPATVAVPLPVPPGGAVIWDGRFQATLDATAPAGICIGALGREAALIAREAPKTGLPAIPFAARATLPVFRDAKEVVAVPALGYFKRYREEASGAAFGLQFRPIRPLTEAGFIIV
jgi:tRNA(Ile)-lysidine synthase